MWIGPSSRPGTNFTVSPSLASVPNRMYDVGLAEAVGDEPLWSVGRRSPARTAGSTSFIESTTGPGLGGPVGQRLDVRVDRFRALVEVGHLLAREVVVETVDDEDRDERQRQRDDGQEREGQAALEGPRDEPAQTTRQPGSRARPARSALGEGVADTSDRQHEHRRRRIVLDLVAQMAHVDVDRLLVLVERLVVAQQLEQLARGCRPGRAARRGGEGSRTRSASG